MVRKPNGCPYQASRSGTCSHKGTKTNDKGKRYCGHEYPHNCLLFREWIQIKESIKKINKVDSNSLKTLQTPYPQ